MLQSVNFNPYAYRSAPIVDGLSVVRNDPVKPTGMLSFEDVYDEAQKLKDEIAAADERDELAHLTLKNFMYASGQSLDEYLGKPVIRNPNDLYGIRKAEMAMRLNYLEAAKFVNCFDFGLKMSALQEQARNADYSGMSDAEKYASIYDRYAAAFGADFLKSTAISFPDDQTRAGMAVKQFWDEVQAVIGDPSKVAKASRAAKYGDMSDSEVRAAIAAKYPPTNQMTLREFEYMVWEMNDVGVDAGLMNVLRRSTDGVDRFALEAALDKPLDMQKLCGTYNMMRDSAAKTLYNDVGSCAVVMRELFGVSFDGRGNASSSIASKVDFDALIRQYKVSYSKWTEKDYENWLAAHS